MRGAEGGWGRAAHASLLLALLLTWAAAPKASAGPVASQAPVGPAGSATQLSDDTLAARAEANAARVRAAFDDWREGTGSVFDLLADDVEWTVAGSSPVSGFYRSKQDFMQRAVAPIAARLATPIVPEVRHVLAEGDGVVVLWDGAATASEGGTYRNSYAWHMEFAEGRVVRVTAFLDTWSLELLMNE